MMRAMLIAAEWVIGKMEACPLASYLDKLAGLAGRDEPGSENWCGAAENGATARPVSVAWTHGLESPCLA